ncbi:hypothetical protein [Leekyejoonella antrihumi]|uniref:hypothetical protein n=1 Tax=Leekyejoonella antrihumi TaxID=1660198 RepID=UPI0016497018|nr:hypothetical protein [Leekyejoonella antrihumi]
MTADPRAALTSLVGALERHLEAAASRRGENDPTVVAAYRDLADAFEAYDDVLLDVYGEVTPLEVYSGDDDDDLDDDAGDDDDDEDFDEDEDDSSSQYVGLSDDDADELDFDEDER